MPGATRVRISIGIKNVKKLAKSELNVTNTLVMPVGRSGASAIPSIMAIIIFSRRFILILFFAIVCLSLICHLFPYYGNVCHHKWHRYGGVGHCLKCEVAG